DFSRPPRSRKEIRVLEIRATKAADLERIGAIYADAVIHGTATYELAVPSRSEMTARYDAIAGKGFPYLSAEEGGEVLGYAYAGPFRARAAYRFIVEDSIYIAPEAKGAWNWPHAAFATHRGLAGARLPPDGGGHRGWYAA